MAQLTGYAPRNSSLLGDLYQNTGPDHIGSGKKLDYTYYLKNNPDVQDYWNKNQDTLAQAGITTPEAWAANHYEKHGKAEGRLLSPSGTTTAPADPTRIPQRADGGVQQAATLAMKKERLRKGRGSTILTSNKGLAESPPTRRPQLSGI